MQITTAHSVLRNSREAATQAVTRLVVGLNGRQPDLLVVYLTEGLDPTEHRGLVTKADGRRIVEIDGTSAAHVYDRWNDGMFADLLDQGGNVLERTSLRPLGVDVSGAQDAVIYSLIHPVEILANGMIETFAKVEEGVELVLMRGAKERLIHRAGKVAMESRAGKELIGSLGIYCAGCMLTVRDQIDQVADEINHALGGNPLPGWLYLWRTRSFPRRR